MIKQDFETALGDLIEASPEKALALLTGHFVGLTLALLRSQGHEPDGDILIDGGKSRDITIHKPKGGQHGN